MTKRGGHRPGAGRKQKLTQAEVVEAFDHRRGGTSWKDLEAMYGLSRSALYRALRLITQQNSLILQHRDACEMPGEDQRLAAH